jgi:hypothetical protein
VFAPHYDAEMKIAPFNVNGVNGRLPVLTRWLAETQPQIVCLQELKAPDDKFPEPAIRELGYRAIWHGEKSWNGVAILARDREPMETRRGLPGDPDDAHSRYIEAAAWIFELAPSSSAALLRARLARLERTPDPQIRSLSSYHSSGLPVIPAGS